MFLTEFNMVSSMVISSQTRKPKSKKADFLAKPDQTVTVQQRSGTFAAGRLCIYIVLAITLFSHFRKRMF